MLSNHYQINAFILQTQSSSCQTQVHLKFDPQFHKSFVSGMRFSVRFSVKRSTFMFMQVRNRWLEYMINLLAHAVLLNWIENQHQQSNSHQQFPTSKANRQFPISKAISLQTWHIQCCWRVETQIHFYWLYSLQLRTQLHVLHVTFTLAPLGWSNRSMLCATWVLYVNSSEHNIAQAKHGTSK